MIWQDIVIATGQYIFVIALLPSIRNKEDKPALSSSVITSIVLFVFAYTFGTLHLWNSAFSTLLSSIAWVVLAVQKYRLDGWYKK